MANKSLELLKYVPREEWGAAQPKRDRLKILNLPVGHIVTSWTETEACLTKEECVARVKAMQTEHMEKKGLPDIEYNFLLGSDGYLYEGRGWNYEGPSYRGLVANPKELAGDCIEVAFLDSSDKNASENSTQALSNLITMGVKGKVLKDKIRFYCRSDKGVSFVHLYNTNEEDHYHKSSDETRSESH